MAAASGEMTTATMKATKAQSSTSAGSGKPQRKRRTRKPAGFQALAAHDEEAEEEVVAEESHQEREDAGTARVGVGVVVAGRGGSGMD